MIIDSDYPSQMDGVVVFPNFPFPDKPKPGSEIKETVASAGAGGGVATISAGGTVDQTE